MNTGSEFKLVLKTIVDFRNEQITHELSNAGELVFKEVMSTRNESVRRALIQLGWTPPAPTVE